MEVLFDKILSTHHDIQLRSLKNILFKLQHNLLLHEDHLSSPPTSSSNFYLLLDKIFEYFYLLSNDSFYNSECFLIFCQIIQEIILKFSPILTDENILKLSQELITWSVKSPDEEVRNMISKVIDLESFFLTYSSSWRHSPTCHKRRELKILKFHQFHNRSRRQYILSH